MSCVSFFWYTPHAALLMLCEPRRNHARETAPPFAGDADLGVNRGTASVCHG